MRPESLERGCLGRLLVVGLALGLAAACSRSREAPQEQARSGPTDRSEIAVLGDPARAGFIETLARHFGVTPLRHDGAIEASISYSGRELHFAAAAGETVAPHAVLAAQAEVVLICVDATRGPLPIVREHVILARQMQTPEIVIAFAKSGQVDDAELLDLEELEMRELLSAYALPGDQAACVFDNEAAPGTTRPAPGQGPEGVLGVVAQLARGRPPTPALLQTTQLDAAVYALVPEEAFRHGVAAALQSGPATVVVQGRELQANLSVGAAIAPGDNGTIRLAFGKVELLARGQRFVLVRNGHISAAGTIAETR